MIEKTPYIFDVNFTIKRPRREFLVIKLAENKAGCNFAQDNCPNLAAM